MRVVCIDKGMCDDLTNGKTYEVIEEDKYDYYIINDNGIEMWYCPKECFKTISKIRNEKIDKLLGDE